MEQKINITLIANTGILLQYGNIKILIDGIYGKEGHDFSNIGVDIWEKIKKGQGIFSNIDYLLFTHEHPDHFSPEMTMEYLNCQRPKGLFISGTGTAELGVLQNYIRKAKIPCVEMKASTNNKTIYTLEPGFQLRVYSTAHLGEIFKEVPHFCFLLTFDGKNILFTSDVDFLDENFLDFQDAPIHAIFINPLFYHGKVGQRLLIDVLRPQVTVIYHVPFLDDDKISMRKMIEKDMISHQVAGTSVIVLQETYQSFEL